MTAFAGKPARRLSFRPVDARPCVAAMPLTLITGPANAAKAGEVLRAHAGGAAARSGAGRADERGRAPLLARAGRGRRRVRGGRVDVLAADGRRRAALRGLGARVGGARAGPRGSGVHRRRVAVVVVAVGARAGVRGGAGRLLLRAAGVAWPGRGGSRPRCARGRARRRMPASWPRCTPRTTGGWSRWGPSMRTAWRGRRWTRCGARPRRGAGGRCSSTGSTSSRGRSWTRWRR